MYANTLLKTCLCLVMAILSQWAYAQNKVITGKITNSKGGDPIEGASVTVQGAVVGTSTNADGTFSLTAGANARKIKVSSLGFASQEINIGGRSEINIQLVPAIDNLGEVIVVGYGSQKRKEVTSAITTINADQFNKGNINNVAQLMQGKVAGLSIARPGGNPNRGFVIRLRGLSTIGPNASPLIVVDGQVGADLNSIDPNDIQSISVLKDGSSAAIYGTRGSAGVIIVSTKTGSKGTSMVNYNASVQIENAVKFMPHLTADEFRKMVASTGVGTDYGASTDWNDLITRTAISHTHNLAFSGGSDKTTYHVSLNYRDNPGISIKTGAKQLNGHIKLVHKAFDNRVVFNLDLTSTKKDAELGFEKAFQYATTYNPTSPVYATLPAHNLSGGGYFEVAATEYSNPYAMLVQNTNNSANKRTNISGSVEIELLKGLKLLTRYAEQYNDFNIDAYTPSTAFIDRGFYNGATGLARHGYLYKELNRSRNRLYENTLTWIKRFNKIELTALGGYSYQDFSNDGQRTGAGNFVTDIARDNYSFALDFANGFSNVSSYKNGSRLVAFFGRVNLNYDDIAYLAATLRREGSTQFGKNNQWGYFPAASAGLNIHRLVDIPEINILKLRASYGVTGSLPPRSYLSLFLLSQGQQYLINGQSTPSFQPSQNANPDLKWETKSETNIGLDFELLSHKLSGAVDYYVRTTNDLIFNAEVPSPPALFNRAWKNVGDLKARGFEVVMNYKAITGKDNFSWTTGGNFSKNFVKLERLDPSVGNFIGTSNLGSPGQEQTQITRTFAGEEIGAIYGPIYKGLDANGKYLFDDGKGGTTNKTDYKTVIGHGLPDFEIGFTNTVTYKNFDLNVFFRGSFGHDIVNTERVFYENPSVISGTNMINSKYFLPNLKSGQIFSSYYVEKGDFVKLDNATLSYNFKLNGKFGEYVKSLRAYITGYNLLLVTGYTGADPEVRYVDGDNVLAPGIDRRETWALTRSFTLGINVNF